MPIITQLKPQRNGKRVNVYVDNKFGFGIDLENLITEKIKINKEFTEEELNRIIKKAEFQKTYDKLLRFVMTRPRSENEIDLWFRRKKVPEILINNLKLKIKNLKLLNDEAFAKWWIQQRLQFKFKSKREITSELILKGIKKELIKQLLEDADVDEEKLAQEQLTKNAYKWEKYDPKTSIQKQAEFLARKGFGWGIIKKLTGRGCEE